MKIALILVALVLTAACVVTPLLYSALLFTFGQELWPYSRIFNRVVLAFFLIGLFSQRKRLRLDLLKPYFVAHSRGQRAADLAVGFLLTIAISTPLLFMVVGNSQLAWADHSWAYLLEKFVKTLPAALVTGVLEESIFRVLLLQGLLVYLRIIPAVLCASFIYGWVHFITPDNSYLLTQYGLLEGFYYFAHLISRSLSPALLPAIAGLTLVGIALNFALLRTRSVFLGIGMHAGWIIVMKMSFFSTVVVPGAQFIDGIGRRYFLVAEPITWVSVLVVLFLVHTYASKFRKETAAGGN
jgi:membrane protease YdiL (CAAX protease family)